MCVIIAYTRIQQGLLATVLGVGYGQLQRTRVASCLCNNHFFVVVLFSCYSHQSISDYSWPILGGVHCTLRCVLQDEPTCMRIEPV